MINEPKTTRGLRSLPMHAGLMAALRATRERTLLSSTVIPLRGLDDRLSSLMSPMPLTPDRYSDLLAKAVATAGLPPMRLHDLRHVTLSILLAQGIQVHVVAKLAGRSPSFTLRTYAHARDAAEERLGDLFGIAS